MITYEDVCKKLGFDPNKDYTPYAVDYPDDSVPSPFSILTMEELRVMVDYLIAHRDERLKKKNKGKNS